jgi:hypothetical protein
VGSVWLKTLKYSARNSSFKASAIGNSLCNDVS